MIGKAIGVLVSFLKGTDVPYEDGSHVFFLNSRYKEANASKPILEFLDLIRTNDIEKRYETPLGEKAREKIRAVRSDRTLEVSYMTYAQKMLDERRLGYAESRAEGEARGRAEGIKEAIVALRGFLESEVIAERFKVPLKQVLDILGQNRFYCWGQLRQAELLFLKNARNNLFHPVITLLFRNGGINLLPLWALYEASYP